MPAVRPRQPGVRIPYLGTTLPPQSVMNRYFGPINDPSREVTIMFCGHTVTINKVLAGNLAAAGHALQAAGLSREVHDAGGFRTTIGGSGSPIPYSMHQYGAAVDINEGSQDWHTMTLDPRLVSVMASFHWFCGENWGGASRDGGHFQFTGGTRVLLMPGGGPVTPGPAHPPLVVVGVLAALFGAAALLVVGAGAAVAAGTVWAARKAKG